MDRWPRSAGWPEMSDASLLVLKKRYEAQINEIGEYRNEHERAVQISKMVAIEIIDALLAK